MIKPVKWKTRLELLSAEEVRGIHQASLRIMESIGLVRPLSSARQDQARDLGLKLDADTQRVYFPSHIIEAALKQAPRCFTLCARNPANDLVLDGDTGYLTLDGSGADVLDLDTGAVRPSTKADLEAAVRVADALPQIAFLWPAVRARDCAPAVQPLHELEAMLTCSSKHAQAMTAVDALNARGTLELAAEVVGGREVWQPSVIDRSPRDEWVRRGRPTADDHAKQKARNLLATYQPEPLPCADRLREIIAAYERQSMERRQINHQEKRA